MGGGCSVAECKSEATEVVFRLIAAWQQNYGNGCEGHEHAVGEHLCWGWSTIFNDALSGGNFKCFGSREWAAGLDDESVVHWFTIVQCGKERTKECSVIFDDGFFHDTTAHDPRDDYLRDYRDVGWDWKNPKKCYQRADCRHVPIGF